MASDAEKDWFFDKTGFRWGILWFIVILFFCVATWRLFDLQVVQHDYWVARASAEHTSSKTLVAKRGEIYMMDGTDDTEIVVMNERTWTIFIDPNYVVEVKNAKEKVQAGVSKVLADNGVTMLKTWDEVWADTSENTKYIEIAKHVDYKTMTQLKAETLPGVGHVETSRRIYPYGSTAAQVLGFSRIATAGEEVGGEVLTESKTIGLEGIESYLDARLSGTNGSLKYVRDVNDVPLSIGDENIEVPAQDGENLVLTLDINIQRKVEQILAQAVEDRKDRVVNGSVLVMNPQNGQVMAMANYPTYEPANFSEVEDTSVFRNRITELPYEPASVCKPLVYAAAINEGAIKLTDTYNNTGTTNVSGIAVPNAYSSNPHLGTLTFQQALNYSYNTGSTEVLRRIGGGTINRYARDTYYKYLKDYYGFGKRTGIELLEVSSSESNPDPDLGILYSPDDPEGNAVKYSNMTFGQGMSMTMLQLAAAFSSVINGGDYYQPTILAGTIDEDGVFIKNEASSPVRTTVTAETSAIMRKSLKEVRYENGGKWADPAGYGIGAKTGTAETIDEETGKYTSDKTNVSVLGFGGSGYEDAIPEYVILVRMDGNAFMWGVDEAVPVFNEVSNYLLDYLRIEPNL